MKATTTGQTTRAWQVMAAMAMAIILGLMMAGTVDATGKKTLSQLERMEIVSENCEDLGGSIEVTDGPFEGVKYTRCVGGELDGQFCAHGQTKSNCKTPTSIQTHGDIVVNQSFTVATDTVSTGQTFEVAPSDTATLESSPGTVTLQPLETKSTAP